jgi:sigma-B regulation protein RsbU (phosphoserine phosphatase)
MVRAALRARLGDPHRPAPAMGELLGDVNRVLVELERPDRFATAAVLRLDERGAEVALAGHLPVLRVQGGTVERIDNQHVPLGIRADEAYCGRAIAAAPGDLFVLFTDGVVEVDDGSGRQLGLDALESELVANAQLPLPALHEKVLARVRRHGRANDDVTLLLLRLS